MAVAAVGSAVLRERWVSGQYGGMLYEHCLTVELDDEALRVRPARWVAGNPPLEVPLAAIISVYFHPNRFAPQVEVVYARWGGPDAVVFSPSNPRVWLERARRCGVPVRPYDLPPERLPARNLARWLHLGLFGSAGAAGLLGLLLALARAALG